MSHIRLLDLPVFPKCKLFTVRFTELYLYCCELFSKNNRQEGPLNFVFIVALFRKYNNWTISYMPLLWFFLLGGFFWFGNRWGRFSSWIHKNGNLCVASWSFIFSIYDNWINSKVFSTDKVEIGGITYSRCKASLVLNFLP